MDSLFWKSVDRAGRGHVEGFEPGYGRFSVTDIRGRRVVAFTPTSILDRESFPAKGDWCRDFISQLQREIIA